MCSHMATDISLLLQAWPPLPPLPSQLYHVPASSMLHEHLGMLPFTWLLPLTQAAPFYLACSTFTRLLPLTQAASSHLGGQAGKGLEREENACGHMAAQLEPCLGHPSFLCPNKGQRWWHKEGPNMSPPPILKVPSLIPKPHLSCEDNLQ